MPRKSELVVTNMSPCVAVAVAPVSVQSIGTTLPVIVVCVLFHASFSRLIAAQPSMPVSSTSNSSAPELYRKFPWESLAWMTNVDVKPETPSVRPSPVAIVSSLSISPGYRVTEKGEFSMWRL